MADERGCRDAERGWIGMTEAARYANLSQDHLRAAVIRGELEAYEKPLTKGRTGKTRCNAILRTKREFVDEWIRTHWKRAGADSYGLPAIVGGGDPA